MSTKSNVYSQGGGGTTYEFEVQTAFMIQFIIGGIMPGISDSRIDLIRLQSGSLNYQTDDLLLECSNETGQKTKVLFQIKHNLTISEKSPLFSEVLKKIWDDFVNEQLFNPNVDKIYIVKSYLTSDEKKHLKTLCNWAKVKSTSEDFINEAKRIPSKNNYLLLFRKVLKNILNKEIDDENLYRLFVCLDFIEYDFGEAASTAKANLLTLIECSKDSSCTLPSVQIWDSVFSFVSHADNKGGSFNSTNIPAHLKSFFNSSYYTNAQKKLLLISQQSFELINIINDKIGNITLDRQSYLERITTESINNNITIITGVAGSGKSVLAKQFISNIRKNSSGYTLVFKADELNKISLRDYFLKFDIHLTTSEIFSFFPLHNEHYIYIDSFEKLLEGESDAFKQLLNITSANSKIKIIATCREADLSLIRIKYLSESKTEPIKVKLLNDEELLILQEKLPTLAAILKNKRIHSLLKVPKYLDFAYRANQLSGDNFSESDEHAFIQNLWDIIVENKLNNSSIGLPERRNKQFVDLAVTRAKKMAPYIIPLNPDVEALANLLKDGVVAKSNETDAYTPAHDILEDWALIKYVDWIFFQQKDPLLFFTHLGTEPAMRRAFRLWTLQALKSQNEEKLGFFTQILSAVNIESYWQDESVIALLYSPYLATFLESNKELLLKNKWALLSRFIHIMRTSCREYGNIDFLIEKKFIPISESWNHIISFIAEHLDKLPIEKYDLVLHTINDWHYVLYCTEDIHPVAGKAGIIVEHLLENQYINQDDYYYRNDNALLCVKLLLDCCGAIPDKTKKLIEIASANYEKEEDGIDRDWKKIRFYEKIVETALSGPASTQLAKHLPAILISLMKKEWILPDEPEVVNDDTWAISSRRNSRDSNTSFGLASEYKRDYFPASAYQTPVYWLLKYHTIPTIDFVIDLLNHSTEAFLKSDYARSDERLKIDIYLPDGRIISQHGSMGLWSMFRGTGIATPYLLQSVLMGLEKYLFEIGDQGIDQKEFLQSLIERIITGSNNISLTAVISSVAQAYPLMVGKWIVSLFSGRKIMHWDMERYRADQTPFYLPGLDNDKLFQQERIAADKLPHRSAHNLGLKGFIINYCFNYREYNKEIFALLEKHKKAAKRNDWEWKKILFEIDIRNWEITNKTIIEDKMRVQLEPVHKGKLKQEVAKMQEEMSGYVESSSHTNWLLKVLDSKEQPDIKRLKEIIKYYQSQAELNPHNHHPGIAASIAVKHFWNDFTEDDKQWCIDIIYHISSRLIQKDLANDYLSFDTSPFDDDAVMEVIPLLLGANGIDRKDYKFFLINVLFANINYNSIWYNKFLNAFSNHLWNSCPDEALHLWLGLLQFAKIEQTNPFHSYRKPADEEVESYNKAVNILIDSISKGTVSITMDEIDFKNYSQWILLKAIKIVPVNNTPVVCRDFLLKSITLFIQFQQTRKNRWDEDDRLIHHIQPALEEKTGKVILWNALHNGREFLNSIIDLYYSCYNSVFPDMEVKGETSRLFRDIMKNIIYDADRNLPDNNNEKLLHTINCFKNVWEEYFNILVQRETLLSGDLLFLNVGWNENSRHWKPLDVMAPFFKKLILLAGKYYPEATVNLLSHIGDQTLLPDGLTILWTSLQQNSERPTLRSIPHIEQLVYRVYNYHLIELKRNSVTLANYISMLDELIKEGSSDAYWIREYLISFK
ncbi:hypothetical protein ESA94_13800 [Lacibacter luteus]|uniref:ATP-binding protein n=1 Tax=Lacibacter luteus TaxID=2508719 RepID=A0A4Q1CGD8_9BACT|nr:hypothetical protein [Lacibacter luteus]RXK59210.1 hypothetical protein ESA94_13800 [Lacibacter luteus]